MAETGRICAVGLIHPGYPGAAAVGKLGGGRNVPTIEELSELILQDSGDIEIRGVTQETQRECG